jgi:fibronectin type 3 domain-containing protein
MKAKEDGWQPMNSKKQITHRFECLYVLGFLLTLLIGSPVWAQDRTIPFLTSDPGVDKSIEMWGLDLAWRDGNNVRRGAAFTGADKVDVVRISFTGVDPVVNGDLQQADVDYLNQRLAWVNAYANTNTVLYINEDTGELDPWYKFDTGFVNPLRWAQMIEATTRRAQESGRTVACVLPFNEVDVYTDHRIGYMQTVHETVAEMLKMPRFDNIRISSCALNPDGALGWYDYSRNWLDEAVTHQLAGTFDNYAKFFTTLRAQGKRASNDELHNVMEAMVGAEYGMQCGIWWGTADLARGEFVKASDGKRLGYAEHRDNWTSAAVYRAPDGKVQAFVGESERQALPTTYRFYSKDRPVFYDGDGPRRDYTVATTGGPGYGNPADKGAERVVNITWGDDVPPNITSNRYILVNRNSQKVMEVAGASTNNGANIQQNTYAGGLNQQWDIMHVPYTNGGDWSYFKVAAAHSGKSPDINAFSFDNGGNIQQWDNGGGSGGLNQQWYFQYVGDGWFYIRSRWDNKCIEVSGASTANGANIQQWDVLGGYGQQWRLLPVGAAIEFVAPVAPAGLAATTDANSVTLTWNANSESDLASYTVLRSTTNGGPYEIVGRGITGTSFTDTEVTSSAQYYYVVRAVDQSLNRSAYSGQVACKGGLSNQTPYFVYTPLWRDAAVIGTAFSGFIAGDANDLDPDTLTFSKVSGPAWLNVAANGALSGTPAAGDAGNNSWVVRVSDGHGGTADATLNMAVDYPVTVSVNDVHTGTTAGLTPGDYTQSQLLLKGIPNDGISSFHLEPGYRLVVYRDNNFLGDSATHGSYDITGLWYSSWDNSISSLRVQALGNTPYFDYDPFTKQKVADIGVAYSDSIWNDAHDPNYDSLSFSKIFGPSWLTVSSIGEISGTPGAGDVGLNSFVVRVSDGNGGTDDATLRVLVSKPAALVARYELNGNVLDSSGNGLNGTASGSPAYVSGVIGQAIDLDAVNDVVTLPSSATDQINFTIACWVNWDGGGAWQRIFDFGNNTSQYMYLSPNGSGGALRFVIRNGGTEYVMEAASALPINTWTHVAVTFTGQNAKLFVNGAEVANNAFVMVKPYDFHPVNNWIGDSQFSADPLFNGRIDDFRIYNYALGRVEVASLAGVPTGLAASAVSTNQISLAWTAALGASSYNVKRATTSGGPYTTVGSPTTTNYSDTGLITGATYYYVVSAINVAGESTNSSQAMATTIPANRVVSSDEFMYSASALSGKNGGSGFGGAWNTGGSVVAPGLTNGVLVVASNAASLSGQNAFRPLRGGINLTNEGTIWISVLGQRTDASTQWGGLSLFTGTSSERFFLGTIGGNYGFLTSATLGASQFNGPASSQGATTFLVCQLQSSGTNVIVRFYANPVLGTAPPVSPTDTANIGTFAFDTIRLGTGGNFKFDEIRIGSSWANVVPLILPPAPTGLTATADNAQVTLNWSASLGATSYSVKRATVDGGPYSVIVTNLTTSYTNTGLVNGTTYYYVVSALNALGEGTNSIQVRATPLPPIPSAPLGVTASPDNGQVGLSWNASSGATSYKVKRATVNGGPYATVASPTGNGYTDTALVNGTTYYYVISADNISGESANSSPVSATPSELHAHWKLDEASGATAADSSGNGNTSTLQSGAAWTTAGKAGNALSLTGATNSYVVGPQGMLSALNDFTVSAWINVSTNATWARVFDFGTGTANYMFVSPASGDSTLRYAITTNGIEQRIDGPILSTCVWHHVVVTLSGSVGVLYDDGVAVGTNTSISIKPSNLGSTTQNYIGKSQWADPYLSGTVDDFRIYRRALSAAEVSTLFTSNGGGPAAPTSLVATPGSNQVVLSWNVSLGATSYNVKRATMSGGPYTIITNPTAAGFTDTTVVNGTAYYYVVSAVNISGEGTNSSQVSVTPAPIPPVPAGLAATAGDAQVALSWDASSGATIYNVKRATINGRPYLTITNVNATSFTNTGLVNGTTYYYVVSAVNAGGESANSSQVMATPQPPIPATPTGLTATAGDAQVALNWAASSGATSYNVKRSTTNGGPFTPVTNIATTAYTNTGLVNGTTYYYVVSALNDGGESGNSAPASARPVSTAPAPLTVGTGAGAIQLAWPAEHLGWRLQSQTNTLGTGLGTNWFDVPGSTATNSMNLPMDSFSGSVFYRLIFP